MTYSIITEWPAAAIAVVTFSDPVRLNQLCWAAIDALAIELKGCRESGARVVILASGLDGHWLEHAWLRDLSNGVQGLEQTGTGAGWFEALGELAHEDVVSIAAIAGDTSGGGAELGWGCDLRVAESTARFSQPEVNMGLTTGIGGTSRLARLAGRSIAAEMVLTGAAMSAQRLYEVGAINKLVGAGEALPAAFELARQMVNKSPAAIAHLKRILANSDDTFQTEALIKEQEIFQSIAVTDQAIEAMEQAQSQYDAAQTNNSSAD